MVAGSTRRASPTWPRRWCSTRRRRQSSGRSRLERALFWAPHFATPRHTSPPPGAAAVLPQLPPLPPRAGAVSGAPRLGSPASQGWHGWLWVACGAPHSGGAAVPCRAESLVRGRGRGTHASAQGADPESSLVTIVLPRPHPLASDSQLEHRRSSTPTNAKDRSLQRGLRAPFSLEFCLKLLPKA